MNIAVQIRNTFVKIFIVIHILQKKKKGIAVNDEYTEWKKFSNPIKISKILNKMQKRKIIFLVSIVIDLPIIKINL